MKHAGSAVQWSARSIWLGLALLLAPAGANAQSADTEGSVSVPAFTIPESSLLSDETRARLHAQRNPPAEPGPSRSCPAMAGAAMADIPAIRECEAQAFYTSSAYRKLRSLFRVSITDRAIAGVRTEIILPDAGVTPNNRRRVLINVHGGAFVGGARTLSRIESVPIAALSRIKVVSVDYRMGPDFAFPAASEDVVAVYRALLKEYDPHQIGIYGCSAGGLLTAQSVALILREKLPLPGAIGMLCEGGVYWTEGDSSRMVYDTSQHTIATNPYFKGASADDPLAFPARSLDLLARFPPTLLVTSTRDFALSSTVYTHSRLVSQGVDADLHVWEGLPHAFHMDPELPESREVFAVVTRFFDKHLAK